MLVILEKNARNSVTELRLVEGPGKSYQLGRNATSSGTG